MRKKIKELYEHSTLVAKIRYSYLCLLVPFVLFLIFCFYNLWNNNRRYEDMINSSVMASQSAWISRRISIMRLIC